jgi:hypothetical protein
MSSNKQINNHKLYLAASLAQRELDPLLDAVTGNVCQEYQELRVPAD